VQGSTINATSGITVGGVALSAAMLSNGVSGTGAVCLTSGSLCGIGSVYYQTVEAAGTAMPQQSALDFMNWFTVTDSASPSRTVIGLNTTGSEANLVTAAGSGISTHLAVWDALGGLADGGVYTAPTTPTRHMTTNVFGTVYGPVTQTRQVDITTIRSPAGTTTLYAGSTYGAGSTQIVSVCSVAGGSCDVHATLVSGEYYSAVSSTGGSPTPWTEVY
jgi:hypothetical protein